MALAGLGDETVEVGQGAVLRIDVFVVGDVVAEVDLRRWVDGREPDGVDAEVLEVVEALGDALQVADAIEIRVLKAARIDLVDDGVLPPVSSRLEELALGVRCCARRLPSGDERGSSQKQSSRAILRCFGPVHCGLLVAAFRCS